ncbi:hypothetical protein HIM_00523 [Hirsutella minnesotensis 3608]|nr:hypothetical protein HIM_00523 [Hirsutella minnesotensis 3608]
MRLFLLPVSTRRTLLYAQKLNGSAAGADRSLVDKSVTWAAKKWTQWERKESGWQRKVVDYGNHAFRRIPYEEWGLKSVPPLSPRRRNDERAGRDTVELVFPGKAFSAQKAKEVAMTLATERMGLHRQKMMWCLAGMPLTIPFALIPIIPNLPFFYLVYRFWSHWRARAGGRHVQWLVQNQLLLPSPSEKLDQLYSSKSPLTSLSDLEGPEKMLLTQVQVRNFSKTLDVPELELELERAIWQVEKALQTGKPTSDTQRPADAGQPVRTREQARPRTPYDKKGQ